ncbi:MAG: hypothetical protein NT154_18945, partial [Verrucomicrobia bacterium]|nr:hypothetical protein [Verrucomicrobiota bacterium]
NDEFSVSRFIFAGEASQCEGVPLPVSIPGKINPPGSPGFIHPSAHIEEKAGPVSTVSMKQGIGGECWFTAMRPE